MIVQPPGSREIGCSGAEEFIGILRQSIGFCLVFRPGSGLEYLFERVGQECEAFENQVGFPILLGMGAVVVIGKPLGDAHLLFWSSCAPEIL